MSCGPAVTCPLPAWPEAQQRGTSPPSVRAAPPPEEPRPSTLCGPAERLKFVFGSSAVAALDLVDQHSVTRIVSPSGRAVYQVLGSSGKLYTCYASCHFCTCPAFAFSVLRKNNSLMCKHILAMYLSQATGACQELSVSDQQLASILLAEEEEEGLGTMC
uniref:Zinc finger SWIM-type containing 7 n=1 Tax=Gopherus evgoodei TaxID=1825980 RepID=A0A8C4W2W8_9SAUR